MLFVDRTFYRVNGSKMVHMLSLGRSLCGTYVENDFIKEAVDNRKLNQCPICRRTANGMGTSVTADNAYMEELYRSLGLPKVFIHAR